MSISGGRGLALPRAIELAEVNRGSVIEMTVVRVLKAMVEVDLMISGARDKLIKIVSGYRSPNIPLTVEVCLGGIGHEILSTSLSAAHVAQHAKCAILVLRRPEESKPDATRIRS